MNIFVCLKQVPDPNLVPEFTSDARSLNVPPERWVMNPYDEVALEAALRIKDVQQAVVTAVTVGPVRAEQVLRSALAMGADAAIHLLGELSEGLEAAQLLANLLSLLV